MKMLSEKYVIKTGSFVLLTYLLISISIYFILKYENIVISNVIINSGIGIFYLYLFTL